MEGSAAAHQLDGHTQPQVQAGESLNHPAFMKGKVAKPMIEKIAGQGIYYRVSIISELKDRFEVFFPACEGDAAFSEWLWRTSSRIHRPGSGKWSYVSRGGWRFNVKASKKRGRGKGGDGRAAGVGKQAAPCDAVRSHENVAAMSCDPSASDCSHATTSSGCKTGHGAPSAVALWFEAHLRARRAMPSQDGDRMVAMGPAMPSGAARSHMRSSADVQSKSSAWSCEDATSVRRHEDHDTSMQPPAAKVPAHEPRYQQQSSSTAGQCPGARTQAPSWHVVAAASPAAEPPPQHAVCALQKQQLAQQQLPVLQAQQAQYHLAVQNAQTTSSSVAAMNVARKALEQDGHDSAPEQDSRRSSSTVDNHSSADEQNACEMVQT